MPTVWSSLWRWLRFLVAIAAFFLVVVLGGAIWLLSGQHYQAMLTEQLGQLLGAEVRITGSHLSFVHGLGIKLDGVAVQVPAEESPFLTADHLAVLLDVRALLHGQLLFHRVDWTRPHVRFSEGGGGPSPLVRGLLAGAGKTDAVQPEHREWFTATLAVHHLEVYEGEVEYLQKAQGVPLFLTRLGLFLSYSEKTGITLHLDAALGQKGDLGTVAVQASAPEWDAQTDPGQIEWQGKILLQNVLAHQVGRSLGVDWLPATLDMHAQYQGKKAGPIELEGEVRVANARLGAVQVRAAKAKMKKLHWAGVGESFFSLTWASFLHATTAELQLEQVQGSVGNESAQFTLHKGDLTFRDEELTIGGLSGSYGSKSRLLEGGGTMKRLFSQKGPDLAIKVKADLDLQDDLHSVLAGLPKADLLSFSQKVQKIQGSALVALELHSSGPSGATSYDGEITFQQAAFLIPTIKRQVTDITGKVRVTNDSLATDNLILKFGPSSLQVTGQILDYVSPRRRPDLWMNADLDLPDLPDLEKSAIELLGLQTKAEPMGLSQFVTQPRGRAEARIGIQLAGSPSAISYDGEVTFRQVAFNVLKWNLDVSDLTGAVQVHKETLTTDGLSLKVGKGSVQLKGSLRDYLTAQRNGDVHLIFTDVRDADLVPFLPLQLVPPQSGTLGGQADVTLRKDGQVRTAGKVTLNRVLIDPLPAVFYPMEVTNGDISWQGQSGTFVVNQGRLPGGAFTGSGQFLSFSPFNMEMALDFADFDLNAVLKSDQPKKKESEPKDDTVTLHVDLNAGRLVYKTFTAEQVRASFHWHDRQVDFRVAEEKAVGGTIDGEGVLWPDTDAFYLAPQIAKIDVGRFFAALGAPSDVLSGTLSGGGKIYMSKSHDWGDLTQWDAQLSLAVADGVAQRVPILVRLWSAVSLQGLLSLQLPSLPTEGLAFSSLTGDFGVGGGLAVTQNLSLSGSSVRIDASGEIDLVRRTVDLKTALMPLHGITSSVAKVPLAGGLLARGADMLTTLPFRIHGPYLNPTVTPLIVNLGAW